jgi:hypothetical protein
MRRTLIIVGLVGCANDPQYISAPTQIMSTGAVDAMGNPIPVFGSLSLPIKPESKKDAMTRAALAAKLGVMVPYVKVGDLEVEISWQLTNPDTTNPAQAKIELDGGNEYFYYDPALVNLATPGEEDPPPTPGLQGDIPIDVPPGGTVTGLFREDQLQEASVDVDMITRGNISPFHAVLTINRNTTSFQPQTAPMPAVMNYMATPVGPIIPRAAYAELVCYKVVLKAATAMTLTYTVRVRDVRGTLIDPLGLQTSGAIQPADVMFAPAAYTVGAATGPAQSPCIPM